MKKYGQFFLATIMVLFNLFCMSVYAASPSEQCVSCHQQQVDDWKQSDHFHAMEKATVKTSLGQFDGRSIEYLGQPAVFSQDAEKKLWVDFVDEEGKAQHLQIEYTFGYQPLQQYIFDAGKGRKQFIPFAWDSRVKPEGVSVGLFYTQAKDQMILFIGRIKVKIGIKCVQIAIPLILRKTSTLKPQAISLHFLR